MTGGVKCEIVVWSWQDARPDPPHFIAMSIGLRGGSAKYVNKAGSTLCTEKMLEWADKVYVFESEHIKRIQQHTGDVFISKIENLDIADE